MNVSTFVLNLCTLHFTVLDKQMPVLDLQLHPDHTPLESYVSTDNYKVYVMQSSPYHLLVLYPPALPIQIAR